MNLASAAVPQQARRAFAPSKIDLENPPENPRFDANYFPDFSQPSAKRNVENFQGLAVKIGPLAASLGIIIPFISTTSCHPRPAVSGPATTSPTHPTPELDRTHETNEHTTKLPARRRKPRPKKRKDRDRRCRRATRTIPATAYREMIEAEAHARRLGRVIDCLVTIRPQYLDDLASEERQAFWQRTYKSLEQWFRDKKLPFVLIWSREATRMDGTGEHYHLALHIGGHREALRKRLARTFIGAELDIRDANDDRVRLDNGMVATVATYVGKACHQTIWRKGGIPHRASGPIFGKRSGVSAILTTKAIAAWRTEGCNTYGAALAGA